jgi:hypothetical protein
VVQNLFDSQDFRDMVTSYVRDLTNDVLVDPVVQSKASEAGWTIIGSWFGSQIQQPIVNDKVL